MHVPLRVLSWVECSRFVYSRDTLPGLVFVRMPRECLDAVSFAGRDTFYCLPGGHASAFTLCASRGELGVELQSIPSKVVCKG